MEHGVWRREKLLRYLKTHPFVKIRALARRLRCSEKTIRRDIKRLEEDQMILQADGGVSVRRLIRIEHFISSKAKQAWREKAAIGRAAVGLINPGDRVFLDGGSTVLAMTHEPASFAGITVLTNSLAVASALMSLENLECILLGGRVWRHSTNLFGPFLEEHLPRIHADCAFIGTDGLSPDGRLIAMNPKNGHVSSLMIKSADRVVLLMDSSKAGKETVHREDSVPRDIMEVLSKAYGEGPVSFATLDDIDCLITDSRIPIDVLDMARKAGVRTIVVKPE